MTRYRKCLLMPALVRLMWSSLMWIVGLQSAVVLTAKRARKPRYTAAAETVPSVFDTTADKLFPQKHD